MNLSLYKLRKKLNVDKSGQSSLIAIVLGGVVLSTLIASGTAWYLTMRNNLGDTEDKLEAQTIAMSEWERLSHMSLDELEANRNVLKNPYSAGTDSQFSVSVNLGQKGTFNNGTCGGVSGGYANCFKDTTITVYRDGNRMFTTRTLPLMAGDYTRKEIDNLLASIRNDYNNKDNALKNDYTNKYNTLANRLNGKEFVKNRTPNYDLNLRYEKKGSDPEARLHAYNGNAEIKLASQGDVAILYGTIKPGQKLPLPAGYSASECAWIVSPSGIVDYASENDMSWFSCFVDSNLIVHAYGEAAEDTTGRFTQLNFFVIGMHNANMKKIMDVPSLFINGLVR